MVGQIVGGLTGIASGIIGSRKRKKEQRAAQKEFNQRKMNFEMQDTSNVYADMQNTMEDLTVNQEAAQFQAEQEQQGLQNIMSNMAGAAGGSGIAGMVQAMANQQTKNLRTASADIGRQEQPYNSNGRWRQKSHGIRYTNSLIVLICFTITCALKY